MKIVERQHVREVDASPAVVWWNYWDIEHVPVVHGGFFTDIQVLREDERMAICLATFRLPIFSFVRSSSIDIRIQESPERMVDYNLGLFGVPSVTTITVEEIAPDRCRLTMNYRFMLSGWRVGLAPFLPRMIATWNETVWIEDLPLKLRRQQMLRRGFVDFRGLPPRVADRVFEGEIPFRLPVPRPVDSPVGALKRRLG